MRMINVQFDTLRFKETIARADKTSALAQVAYAFRHKTTDETVEGHMRLIAQVDDGRIIDLEEYRDLEKIPAVMRLISHVAADKLENDC
jgi:ketosteroid isomerase-like protein